MKKTDSSNIIMNFSVGGILNLYSDRQIDSKRSTSTVKKLVESTALL